MESAKGPNTTFSSGRKWVFQTESKIPSRVDFNDVHTDFVYGVVIKMKDDQVTIKAQNLNRKVERFKIEIKGEGNVKKLTEKFGDDFDRIIKHLRVQGWRLLLINPDAQG